MKKLFFTMMIISCALLGSGCSGTREDSTIPLTDDTLITPSRMNEIADTQWHLSAMSKNGKKLSLVDNSEVTFSCNTDGRVVGLSSINRYSGNLNLGDEGIITWNKAFAMTRMAGPPELMAQETEYMQNLLKTSQMHLKDSMLILVNNDRSIILEFER